MIKDSLFSSDVYLTRISDTSKFLPYYVDILTDEFMEKEKGGNASNQHGWQSRKHLHDDAIFNPVVDLITQQLNNIIQSDDIVPIVDALWYNVNPPGAYNVTHVHPSSWYSGAFYLQTDPNTGSIVFTDPRPAAMFDENRILTEGGKMAKEYKPQPGTLIMFPSWLPHLVMQNKSNITKICISFNTHLVSKKEIHA